ncbi:MAG: hypothetical protein OHK0039_35760 [Bacteroidia bacterium]
MQTAIRHALVEFTGTLFLVLLTGLAYGSGSMFAPLAIGLGLLALIYLGESISGAHYNPAVTLACWIDRRIGHRDAGLYLLGQVLGAIAGAALVRVLVIDAAFTYVLRPPDHSTYAQVILAELLVSFLLSALYLLAPARGTAMSWLGLAAGALTISAIFAMRAISGGVFNPALGVGPNLLAAQWMPMLLYTLGPLAGATLAALAGRYFRGK